MKTSMNIRLTTQRSSCCNVDDLMLAGTTEEVCSRATGDRVSAKKVQISQQEVTYLGYEIRQGQRQLTPALKKKNNIANTRAQGPPPDERVSGDCWILQTVDHGVC